MDNNIQWSFKFPHEPKEQIYTPTTPTAPRSQEGLKSCCISGGPKNHENTWSYYSPKNKWMFPKIEVPQNGWFMMENPIKMDDLGVPLFSETPKWPYNQWVFLGWPKKTSSRPSKSTTFDEVVESHQDRDEIVSHMFTPQAWSKNSHVHSFRWMSAWKIMSPFKASGGQPTLVIVVVP